MSALVRAVPNFQPARRINTRTAVPIELGSKEITQVKGMLDKSRLAFIRHGQRIYVIRIKRAGRMLDVVYDAARRVMLSVWRHR